MLVTGAAGFIGSNLVDALLKIGVKLIGIDNLFNGKLTNLEYALKDSNFTFYKADIRDFSFLLNICKDIDIIYHMAAFSSVPDSIIKPSSCHNINVQGTFNILESARIQDIKTIVFASSGAVYGVAKTLPVKEDMPTNPISPYGVSKLVGEKYLYQYSKNYGLNTIALRYQNVYGPKQDMSPYSGVIPKWLGNLQKSKNLPIYGDGNQIRDFVYIKDVINANLKAAMIKNIAGEVFNVGSDTKLTINELAKAIIELWNLKNVEIEYKEPREGDIKEGYADISKARLLLNYEPKYDIHTGLKDYINWIKQNNK
ncbi:MAG: NAD-dependent epimerase/dehydratase family protein [Promethearchaeota archaeon]